MSLTDREIPLVGLCQLITAVRRAFADAAVLRQPRWFRAPGGSGSLVRETVVSFNPPPTEQLAGLGTARPTAGLDAPGKVRQQCSW
jgi:hypothetical protein